MADEPKLTIREQVEARRDAQRVARAKAHAAEYEEHVGPLLLEHDDYEALEVPNAPVEFAGWVVLRRPRSAEVAKLRHIMWQDKTKGGATEAKAKAALELAEMCRVYPTAERYAALIETFPAVGDECGKKAYKIAEAGADADAKS